MNRFYFSMLAALLMTAAANAQSTWCGVYACNKFTASSQAEAEAIAAQAEAWIRFEFANQDDVLLGPYHIGDVISEFVTVNEAQYVNIRERVDIPGQQGAWYLHGRPAVNWIDYAGEMEIRNGYYNLGPGWIGDGGWPDRWQILFTTNMLFDPIPEPSALALVLIGVAALMGRRKARTR